MGKCFGIVKSNTFELGKTENSSILTDDRGNYNI